MAAPRNRILQGDCVRQLAAIEPRSVDLVFADPPFNIGYKYDVYNDRRTRSEFLQFSREWMAAVDRVLRPDGTFWLAIGDEYAAELKLIAQDDIGLSCRSWVIWYYTFGVNCVRAFSRSHTHLFHFVKDPERFTFNGHNPAVRVASARQLVYADGRANSKGRLPDNTWILRPQDVSEPGFSSTHDTWYFARVAGTFREREGFHGCQMPEQLLGRIVRVSSNPGDLVVDPFAGSGTTLVVARKLGRQWLGIELSTDYVQRIRSRIANCGPGDPLDGPVDPVRSAPKTSKGKKRSRFRNGRPVLPMDEDTRKGIVDAYRKSCEGHATDFILCDPELNQRFVSACRKNSLPGDASIWNRLLLRIRKSGGLPKTDRPRQWITAWDTDLCRAASEAAMQLLCLDFALTLDEILCSPVAAAEFDQLAGRFCGPAKASAFELRWAALAIRKRASKSRKLAMQRIQHWPRRLPQAIPLAQCVCPRYEHPGVYVVAVDRDSLYVGETLNIRQRVEQILGTDSWMNFRPQSIQVIETRDQQQEQHGLQSHLIGQRNPILNSVLLRPVSRKSC